ncbi:MAG TPA: HAMP domain-containing sensor histidine kinase [Tepidisphaeraceae bacterium]|jgi:signal transduction histidine kinase|nr:HAMP domain-containing sensor histidine kinase [Tepidisphaeraceae bacterium]
MASLQSFIDWFSGGTNQYMSLYHCMAHDNLWVAITVGLDLAVAAGYVLIMMHWWRNERTLPDHVPAKHALRSMRNIFLFCGLCGYLFIPIKMFWPAWRLYDIFMMVLVYNTWRYALSARGLKVVYNEIGRNEELAADLAESRSESKRKSFFLNAISHDLRTPLNAIMLQSHLADMSVANKDSAALTESLRDIRANARETAELLNTLLEYARLDWASEPVKRSPCNLADLVDEILQRHQAAAQARGLTLRNNVPGDLTIHVDVEKLERVITNLVQNAVKFTETGGVRVEVDARGASVELHVIDTGIGIDPAVTETLFEEFVQVGNNERDRAKGFGLGLTISRRFARHWGGDVLVESRKGSGSRFTILLPDSRLPIAAPATDAVPSLQATNLATK